MDYEKKEKLWVAIVLGGFLLAIVAHYLLGPWGFYRVLPKEEAQKRLAVVRTAESWLGLAESDGSHKEILNVYNSHEPLAMDYVVQDTDSWCAAFVSAVAIREGMTDRIPTECGCERQIGLFQDLGRWQEDDNLVPQPGDLIYYNWNQEKPGENLGWSDHVGIVVGVKWPFIKVIEGNKDDCVCYRIIPVGHRHIRGFGLPDYTSQ